MDASVIIAAGRDDMRACLKSLANQAGGVNYEVIVVGEEGMARPDGDVKWLTADAANPAVKRNRGAKEARGRILAFIDDDATAPADWLMKIMALLDADPSIAGAGGPNRAPEDSNEAERLTDAVLSLRIGSGGETYSGAGPAKEAEAGDIHLVNLAVRREFFLQMGGFNETIGYGGEDSEFIYLAGKLQRAKFLFSPDLTVWHRRRPWGRELLKQRFKLRRQNGRMLWSRPGMYAGHRMMRLALAGILAGPLLIARPVILVALLLAYLIVLSAVAARSDYRPRSKLIVAIAAIHFVSVMGLLAGFIEVPSRRKYSGLSRRPG